MYHQPGVPDCAAYGSSPSLAAHHHYCSDNGSSSNCGDLGQTAQQHFTLLPEVENRTSIYILFLYLTQLRPAGSRADANLPRHSEHLKQGLALGIEVTCLDL